MIYKKGTIVTISNKLEGSRTQKLHKLDRTGFMLQMQGNEYPIYEIVGNRIRIYSNLAGRYFSFNPDDVTIFDSEGERPSQNFKFNEDLLDV